MMRVFPLLAVLCALTLSACSTFSINWREGNADRLARPVFMLPRIISADGFNLKAFERVRARGEMATIYIEGSEDTIGHGLRFKFNPTPADLGGLKLASFDSAPNVIYLARPCQFRQKVVGFDDCPTELYLGAQMFAPSVIAAYNTALNQLKLRYNLAGFHVVGYGSGGGLAAILASNRTDVKSLRTVEGVLDLETFARRHGLPPYTGSINPVDAALRLQNIPQMHYVRPINGVVPADQFHSFAQAFVDDACVGHRMVQVDENNNVDWTAYWTDWSKDVPVCMGHPAPEKARAARMRDVAPDIGPKK